MYEVDWVKSELSNVAISDERIVKRLIKTTETLSRHPHCSIPEACDGWADTKATYRLFDNPKVKPEAILMSHRQQTIERMKSHEVVLAVQDTTFLDFTSHPDTEGIGDIGPQLFLKGLINHTTMAVTVNGVPLGILARETWARDPEERGKRKTKRQRKTGDKESQKWLTALDESLQGVPNSTKVVTVCDREADIYEFFVKAVSENKHLLVRVAQNRRVLEEEKLLVSEVESKEVAGEIITKIPRDIQNKLPERDATLAIKYCPVTLRPPISRRGTSSYPNLKLYAILAEEINPPENLNPIYWLLITTVPVENFEQAVEKIKWYKQRWKIERYHLTLKSGCKVEELQLETAERLDNALAVYSIIAWKLLWIKYESEQNPDASCEIVLQKPEWQALYCMVHKTNAPPETPPTLKEAVLLLAKLGGFLGRKGDGEPGVTVIWRGLARLSDIAQMWAIMHYQSFTNEVGNV